MIQGKAACQTTSKLTFTESGSYLIASLMVSILMQQIRNLLNVDGVIEGCRITNLPLVGRHFALEAFNQVTDGHTARDGVRVDDDVWVDALAGERHVLNRWIKNRWIKNRCLLCETNQLTAVEVHGSLFHSDCRTSLRDLWLSKQEACLRLNIPL